MRDLHGTRTYEVRVAGHLAEHWSAVLGLPITQHEDGTSTLTGSVADQAQLQGILRGLGDVGATLLSVRVLDGAPDPRAR